MSLWQFVHVRVFVSQGTSLLVEKAVKIGWSNEVMKYFVTTDLVVIKMGKSAFDKVVHACFGKVAHPNYMDTITKFEKWLVWNVQRVWYSIYQQGLFFQSEEVVEATHSKFYIFWQRYKVIEKLGERILECVIDFNTKNI